MNLSIAPSPASTSTRTLKPSHTSALKRVPEVRTPTSTRTLKPSRKCVEERPSRCRHVSPHVSPALSSRMHVAFCTPLVRLPSRSMQTTSSPALHTLSNACHHNKPVYVSCNTTLKINTKHSPGSRGPRTNLDTDSQTISQVCGGKAARCRHVSPHASKHVSRHSTQLQKRDDTCIPLAKTARENSSQRRRIRLDCFLFL